MQSRHLALECTRISDPLQEATRCRRPQICTLLGFCSNSYVFVQTPEGYVRKCMEGLLIINTWGWGLDFFFVRRRASGTGSEVPCVRTVRAFFFLSSYRPKSQKMLKKAISLRAYRSRVFLTCVPFMRFLTFCTDGTRGPAESQ